MDRDPSRFDEPIRSPKVSNRLTQPHHLEEEWVRSKQIINPR